MSIKADEVKDLARECGFELAGITQADPVADFSRFDDWRRQGNAADMTYLTDRRGHLRSDPRNLLPEAKTIVCVGKLYNTPVPRSIDLDGNDRGWISRYAWGSDYHPEMTKALKALAEKIAERHGEPFAWRVCVDTAPLLERSYATQAGLGWIGRNTCLINQAAGSWFFLGELLLSIPLSPDSPPPDRCGTCTRCIDACPTAAIIPDANGWHLDARLCISYLTIEKRGPISDGLGQQIGNHVFGCDICQDVCPWNRRAPVTTDASYYPKAYAPALDELSLLSEEEFREVFRNSPVWRTKYSGFLRNVALAMGNAGREAMRGPLERLAQHPDETVAVTARGVLERLARG